jgi:hypothetical protein
MLSATVETWKSEVELEVDPFMLGLNPQWEDCQGQPLR